MLDQHRTIEIRHPDPRKLALKLHGLMAPNSRLGREFEGWGSNRFVPGDVLEWALKMFPRATPSDDVATYFRALGQETGGPFLGHHHPFLELLFQEEALPEGWYASIPPAQDCHEGSHGALQVPVFSRIVPPDFGAQPLDALGVGPVEGLWPERYTFVAFRKKQKT